MSDSNEPKAPPAFDLSEDRPAPAAPRSGGKGGLAGMAATLAVLLWKAKGLLVALKFAALGKYLLTIVSAFASIWFYSLRYGWGYAIGLVLMLFVHESGHALAARRFGLPYSGMVFVPFMGAVVFHRRGNTTVVQDAFVGLMGPVAGTVYGVGCLALAFATGQPMLLALASSTFFINLFNLLPTPPLDGGWIAPLFSPKLLAVGAVLLFVVGFLNPMIWFLALLSLPRIIAGWKAGPGDEYFRATAADRWKYGLAYVGLAGFLALGEAFTTALLGGRG